MLARIWECAPVASPDQSVSRRLSRHPADPLWLFRLQCHCCTAVRWVGHSMSVLESLESVAVWWPGHSSNLVPHPCKPLAIHLHTPLPLIARAHQLCQAFRAGISTLISHLWHSNELRLIIHLWDPPHYQMEGRPFVNRKRWHLCCWPCWQGEWNQNRR